MSRATAEELLLGSGLGRYLPSVDTKMTWWTCVIEAETGADMLLSAMTELRDERWVIGSVTPLPVDGTVHVAIVCRRLSDNEDRALRMQQQPMIVPAPNLGRRS